MKNFLNKTLIVIKKTLIYSAIVCAFGWAVYGGAMYNQFENSRTLVAYAATTPIATSTAPIEQEAPVLQRIGDCESGQRKANGTAVPGSATQYGKDGQVIVTFNNNGTHDTGKYAINSIWGKKATAMSLDLTNEADNYAMAKWIYENKGTSDWSASQKCWYR